MGVIDSNVRLPLMLFALCGGLALGLYGWIELSSKPPVTLTVSSGATNSARFRVYDGGLHLVVLRVDDHGDQDRTRCALGAKPNFANCDPAATPFSWAIYRRGRLLARDTPGPASAISDAVSFRTGSAERDLGSVELKPGGGYVLEVRAAGGAQASSFGHPTVVVREHPWEFKTGGGVGLLLLFVAVAAAAAVTLLWLAITLLADVLSRRRRLL